MSPTQPQPGAERPAGPAHRSVLDKPALHLSWRMHPPLEFVLGFVLLVAPFVAGLSDTAVILAFVLGAVVLGLGISTTGFGGLSIGAHLFLDRLVLAALAVCTIATAVAGEGGDALVFAAATLVFGALVLTTRYSGDPRSPADVLG
jgi:hypothetical protein